MSRAKLSQAAHRTGVEYTSEELDQIAGGLGGVELSIDAEGDTAADTFRLTAQVNDKDGRALAGGFTLRLCTAADGLTLATAPTGAVAAVTGAIEHSPVAKTVSAVVTDAAGLAEIDVTDAGTVTIFPVAELPDGRRIVGPEMTWA